MPLKVEHVNFYMCLNRILRQTEAKIEMNMGSGVGVITFADHFTLSVMQEVLSPYGIVASSNDEEHHISLDITTLYIPEAQKKHLETKTLENILIDDIFWSAIRKIQGLTGEEIQEVIQRMQINSNELQDFDLNFKRCRHIYADTKSNMNKFIEDGVEVLLAFFRSKIDFLVSIDFDVSDIQADLQTFNDFKANLASNIELSSNLRYAYYSRIQQQLQKCYADLLFDKNLEHLVGDPGYDRHNPKLTSILDTYMPDVASSESKYNEDETIFMKLKLDCCVPLIKFINAHPDPSTELQSQKKNKCRFLIEEIKKAENIVDIESAILKMLDQAKTMHKNPLGRLFVSLEGDFQNKLRTSKLIVDNFKIQSNPKPEIK